MAQNSFRTYKGKWLLKKVTLTASVAAVEKGDLIGIAVAADAGKALGTSSSASIVGIAAEDSALSTSTRDIHVWVPNEPKAEMIGRITDGVAVVGTDVDRNCDLESHEGVDVDTDGHHHLLLVEVTIACADAGVGQGIFRIVQTPEYTGGW